MRRARDREEKRKVMTSRREVVWALCIWFSHGERGRERENEREGRYAGTVHRE